MIEFVNAPNKCFFGLDKGGSHSFTIPASVKHQLIDLFELSEGNLQTEIAFKIGQGVYPAEIRLGRVLNIRPHRIQDRKKTDVVKFQWAKFDNTKTMVRDNLDTLRLRILNGEINKSEFVKFRYVGDNIFELASSTIVALPNIFEDC